MKMKGIMLITFLLLAALTIGAVSAEDNNATSVDLQVADEGDDVIALDYDEYDHSIEPYDEEMCIDEEDDEYFYDSVVDITLPSNAKGSFRVFNGGVMVADNDINLKDDDHWEIEDEILYGYLFLDDFNLNMIHDGDNLSFMFYELKDSQYVPVNGLTVTCKVSLKNSVMLFYNITGGAYENDAEIRVKDIELNNTDENFTFVNVIQREGTFIITLEDDTEIFKEDLQTTERPYSEFNDEYGDHYYSFAFSLADLNNYIAQNLNGPKSIKDLIDMRYIVSGDDMYFNLLKDEDDPESEITSDSWTITIKNGKIYFDNEEDEVYIDYDELNIVMDEGWNETVILTYEVKKGINGKIVIRLNDNQAPAFEKVLSELVPDEDDEDSNYYDITIADLNITQAGKYVLYCYFYDENENQIYPYDDDPENLVLLPSQIITGENATIWVNPVPISVDENDITVIKINVTDGQNDDEVVIYVDGNEIPIKITLGNCTIYDDGNYTITSGQLKLGVGNHTLNITCKGTNYIANVTILTDLAIDLADEIVYTTLNDAFVFISLENGEITESSDITGLVNVTITDSEGNVIDTIVKDIDEISSDSESLVIRTNEMNVDLNGTYTVSVRYYNGNKGLVQEKGNVTFKKLSADDYGISINDVIDGDMIIIFEELPLDNNILVSIDGNEPITFSKSDLNKIIPQNKTTYFINQSQLGLTDGPHSISVSIENGLDTIPLANVNVTVDLKENVDPALTIYVGNIEVGNAAIVLITTNSTFTGNVLVQVANKNYTANVENGQGNVSVTGLDVGTYNATAIFAGDAFFISSVKTSTFNVTAKPVQPEKKDDVKPVVKKNTVKLVLKKVKVKRSAKKLVLQATLKINGKVAKAKKIIFKFKGKKYKAKTNKKGVAKVTIKKKVLKKLKKGKKVTYSATYGKVTKKVTVKVKR